MASEKKIIIKLEKEEPITIRLKLQSQRKIRDDFSKDEKGTYWTGLF